MQTNHSELKDYRSLNLYRAGYSPTLGLVVTSVDARAAWPLVLLFANKSTFTFVLVFASILFFALLAYFGYTLDIALKRLRASLAGRRRYVGNYRIRQRRFASGL